jgi:hypothetical protein
MQMSAGSLGVAPPSRRLRHLRCRVVARFAGRIALLVWVGYGRLPPPALVNACWRRLSALLLVAVLKFSCEGIPTHRSLGG